MPSKSARTAGPRARRQEGDPGPRGPAPPPPAARAPGEPAAARAQVSSPPSRRIPEAGLPVRELRLPRPPAPAGSAARPEAVGEGRPAGRGRGDPRPPHRPASGSSGRPEWLPILAGLRQRPAGRLGRRVHRAAAPAGSGWRGGCVRRVRSSQRKGRRLRSPRPPAAPLPLICMRPAPHLHAARPPRHRRPS